MILVTRPATETEAINLAPRLRPEDKREVETASGKTVEEALLLSLYSSRERYAWYLAGEKQPVAMFGCMDDPQNANYGVLWLLAAPEITKARLAVLKEGRLWLNSWSRFYPYGLHNLVDSRNAEHLRWLQILNFEFGPKMDVNGVPFVYAIRHQE